MNVMFVPVIGKRIRDRACIASMRAPGTVAKSYSAGNYRSGKSGFVAITSAENAEAPLRGSEEGRTWLFIGDCDLESISKKSNRRRLEAAAKMMINADASLRKSNFRIVQGARKAGLI